MSRTLFVLLTSVGGAETSFGTMTWWTLAMLAYPETQARAQAELDAVVGRARPPSFADYPYLPYIRAMVKEILRWGTVAPQAVPHSVSEDDWYQGMFIPKGTICIPNVWNMNRDTEVYGENATHFDPARFLDANGDIATAPPDTKDQGHVSYGFGRRECVGRHLANNSLFIDIAVMLWAMKIERKKDASGKILPLDVNGFVDHGIVVSVNSAHTPKVDANLGISSDVRSLSNARCLRASQKLLPCFHRNVSCGDCEQEVTLGGYACEMRWEALVSLCTVR
jgi:cytochrome P450